MRRFRPWCATGCSSPGPTTATGSTRARRRPTCRPTATCCRAGGKGPLAPGLSDRGDGVYLESGSVVDGEVVGPSVIFAGCEIADGARVERSVLGAGSVIEAGALVVDSVLMEGSHVAADAKVVGLHPGAALDRGPAGRCPPGVGARCALRGGFGNVGRWRTSRRAKETSRCARW